MSKWVLLASVACAAFASIASAGEKLEYGAPSPWVRPVTPSLTPTRDAAYAPFAVLNRSLQVDFASNGDAYYSETLLRIQTPLGLRAGQPAVTWTPDTETVTIHKLHILRDGKVIDVLARGQSFIVMRRETSLSEQMIDGELTALMQTEGLEVGDVIDFAYSKTDRSTVSQGRSYALWSAMNTRSSAASDLRVRWPNTKPIRWKIGVELPFPNIVNTGTHTEFSLGFQNYKPPATPDEAPPRFGRFGEIQFSEFQSWREVSSVMAPLYMKASTLRPNSPLKAEAARIAAMSKDPKVRATKALQLVKDKVRFAYRAVNEGGHVPVAADETWIRRFGECKAKTVLLLALLRELGITAEPAVVHTESGDGLALRLPSMGLFDHVIVRATIDGKSYWLDGTSYGDGDIDANDVPSYRWTLPVRTEGADLEEIVVPPLERPQSDAYLTLDASAGLKAHAPARASLVMRGSEAITLRVAWQSMVPEALDSYMRLFWKRRYPWITVSTVAYDYDVSRNETRMAMEGMARMEWSLPKDGYGPLYETDGYGFLAAVTVSREDGKHADVPVVVEHPIYGRSGETVILPDSGKGYSVVGEEVDATLAGVHYKRTQGIVDGRFTMEASYRSLTSEIPLADALAAAEPLEEMTDKGVYIAAPLEAATNLLPGGAAFVAGGRPAASEVGAKPEPLDKLGPKALQGRPATATGKADESTGLTLDDVIDIYRPE
jgi:transglutaminase-like putative cysteine protease